MVRLHLESTESFFPESSECSFCHQSSYPSSSSSSSPFGRFAGFEVVVVVEESMFAESIVALSFESVGKSQLTVGSC